MSSLAINFSPDSRPATATLELGGEVSFREALELRTAVFDAIAQSTGKNLVIELAQIESMDTAALAVLVEACIATRDGDPTVFLMSASESVRKVFKLAGLEEALTRCYSCWEDIETAIAV